MTSCIRNLGLEERENSRRGRDLANERKPNQYSCQAFSTLRSDTDQLVTEAANGVLLPIPFVKSRLTGKPECMVRRRFASEK